MKIRLNGVKTDVESYTYLENISFVDYKTRIKLKNNRTVNSKYGQKRKQINSLLIRINDIVLCN